MRRQRRDEVVTLALPQIQSLMTGVARIEVHSTRQASAFYTDGTYSHGVLKPANYRKVWAYYAYQALDGRMVEDPNVFALVGDIQKTAKRQNQVFVGGKYVDP